MGNQKFATSIKKTIIEFFERVLKDIFPNDTELDLKLIKIKNVTDYIIADIVSSHILAGVELKVGGEIKKVGYTELVRKKNISFFIENKETFFDGLPQDKVETFCDMLVKDERSGGYSDEIKDNIWKYGEVLIKLCEKYKKDP